MSKNNLQKGFTLIEIMVALSVFVVILTVMMGSIVSIVDSNQKSRSKTSSLDSLNFTLEAMSRAIRFGTNYHCGSSGNLYNPLDCSSPSSSFSFRSADGNLVTYFLSSNIIYRSINNGTSYALTPTNGDVIIQNLDFRVFGSYAYGTDYLQPQVIINVSGYSGSKSSTRSNFNLQTTVSQRVLDI